MLVVWEVTEQKIPTKWEYIDTWLTNLNAPKKVINAAIEINNALVDLGLGDNTQDWEKDYDRISRVDRTSLSRLHDLIMTDLYCTACVNCEYICIHCKLGDDSLCTPRHRYADDYFSIVRKWVEKKRAL